MTRFLDRGIAQYVLTKARQKGFRGVLFSGGGENLEPSACANFMEILRFAHDIGLMTNLATNGKHLTPVLTLELMYLLDSIRFSIPPNTGTYSHIGMIAAKISHAHSLIENNFLTTKLYANVLMTPDMEMHELNAIILQLSQLGIDAIRFKAQHEFCGGRFVIRPHKYENHIKVIKQITAQQNLNLPQIMVSKLGEMIEEPAGPLPFANCWYRDFNPLVLGCDARNYACCEMKYESTFDLGEINPEVDNFEQVVALRAQPQGLNPRCFRGCKGYLVNKDLQTLINDYRINGDGLFRESRNAKIKDRVVGILGRTALSN